MFLRCRFPHLVRGSNPFLFSRNPVGNEGLVSEGIRALSSSSAASIMETCFGKKPSSVVKRKSAQWMGLSISEPNFKASMDEPHIEYVRRTFVSNKSVLEDFELHHEVGQGAFGKVLFAKSKQTNKPAAIKVMDKTLNPFCFREAELIHWVKHKNVLECHGVYEDEKNVYLVTPAYTGGELYDYVSDNLGEISPRRAFSLGLQMLQALEACHLAGFAHLDVKPENFMFVSNSLSSPLVLVDFGSAEPFVKKTYAETAEDYDPEKDDEISHLERLTGTAMYMSPEVALATKFSSRSDVWSVGVTLYIMLIGDLPYKTSEDTKDPLFETLDVNSRLEKIKLHPQAQEVLSKMMQLDSSQRYSATEAIVQISTLLKKDRI